MRAIFIILSVIAVIALLGAIPIRIKIYARYENSEFINDYKIKYGFITIKKRKKKSKQKPEKEKAEKKKKKISVKSTFKFIKSNIKEIKRLICDVVGYATKKAITIDKLSVTAISGTDDAMDTALIYGGASAFLYNTVGVLEKGVRTRNISIEYQPDFTEPKIFIEFTCIIKTRINSIIGLAILLLRRVMPIMKKRGEINNGKSN